jgi:hypothetical protein
MKSQEFVEPLSSYQALQCCSEYLFIAKTAYILNMPYRGFSKCYPVGLKDNCDSYAMNTILIIYQKQII